MIGGTTKAMIYGYFNHTKINKKGEEQGLICINYIKPKTTERATDKGWEACYSWVNFSDELWNYLKTALLKQCELKFELRPDYKDSTKYTMVLIGVNDFVIKQ